MKTRSILAALAVALGFFGVAATANADKIVDIQIGVAPPAERVDVAPPPRAGYVYERGHYAIEKDRWVYHEGHFVKEREGHHWVPYVAERRGEVYIYRRGHWDDEG